MNEVLDTSSTPGRHPLVQQNLLDKVITYISPKAGAKRLASRGALALAGAFTGGRGGYGGYNGARIDRAALRAWRPGGGSAQADISPDLPMLRDRTRDAVRVRARRPQLSLGRPRHRVVLDCRRRRRRHRCRRRR